jgi:fatty acid desaturase
MPAISTSPGKPAATAIPRQQILGFQQPFWRRSVFQFVSSFGGFIATCGLMYLLLPISQWLSLALAPLAAVFVVRIFIIQHDCGHQAFFRSRLTNDWLGGSAALPPSRPSATGAGSMRNITQPGITSTPGPAVSTCIRAA